MKRLLIALPLLLLAAGDGITFTKDNPDILKGWRVWGGEWTKKKSTTLSTDGGTLISADKITKREAVAGMVTALSPDTAVAVLLAWDGKAFSEQATRYAILSNAQGARFLRFANGSEKTLGTFAAGLPHKKQCPFQIQRRGKKLRVQFGKQTIQITEPDPLPPGFVGVFVQRGKAQISRLKP